MTRITVAFVAAASLGLGFATPASSAPAQARPAAAPAAAQPVPPEKLDTLLGPIALYPDALVLQVLECSTNPDQVKKLNDWMKQNPDLKGSAAQDAALAAGFQASFVAIVLFPSVVQKMAGEPDWTKSLGQAFTADRAGVFASIQRLRAKAQAMGNLKPSEQQKVETVTTTGGQQVIVIQPTNPEVVYVPQYTTVVYTQPPPPPPPPGQAAAAGLIGFTTGVIIGAAIAENNDCWGYHGGLSNENYEDYAQHRENMASQRGANQGQRQESRKESQAARQSSSSANQAQRQESRGSGQSASSQSAAARGSAQAASAGQRTGADSGAMSGYQSGAKEREASARGRSSEAQRRGPAAQSGGKPSGGSRGGGRGR